MKETLTTVRAHEGRLEPLPVDLTQQLPSSDSRRDPAELDLHWAGAKEFEFKLTQ